MFQKRKGTVPSINFILKIFSRHNLPKHIFHRQGGMSFMVFVDDEKLKAVEICDGTKKGKEMELSLDCFGEDFSVVEEIYNLPGKGKFLVQSKHGYNYCWFVFEIEMCGDDYKLTHRKLEKNGALKTVHGIVSASPTCLGTFVCSVGSYKLKLILWENERLREVSKIKYPINSFPNGFILPVWKNYSASDIIVLRREDYSVEEGYGYYKDGKKLILEKNPLFYLEKDKLLSKDGTIMSLSSLRIVDSLPLEMKMGKIFGVDQKNSVYWKSENSIFQSRKTIDGVWIKKNVVLPPDIEPITKQISVTENYIVLLGKRKISISNENDVNVFINFENETFVVCSARNGLFESPVLGIVNDGHYKHQFYFALQSILSKLPGEVVDIVPSYCFFNPPEILP